MKALFSINGYIVYFHRKEKYWKLIKGEKQCPQDATGGYYNLYSLLELKGFKGQDLELL